MMRRDRVMVPLIVPARVRVNDDLPQRRQLVEQGMPDLFCNLVALCDREVTVHFHVEFALQAVTDPPRLKVVDALDPFDL